MKTAIVIAHVFLIIILFRLCHPFTSDQCLQLSIKLKQAKIAFVSASNYFYRKAQKTDRSLPVTLEEINTAVREHNFAVANLKLDGILQRYPDYYGADEVRAKIAQGIKEFTKQKTSEAKLALYAGNWDKAFHAALLADAADAKIAYILGCLYSSEFNGQQPDFKKAERWFRKAAEQGLIDAIICVGSLYETGKVAIADPVAEAEKWYRKAAEKGHTEAICRLGLLLERVGRVKEAAEWLLKAAGQSEKTAQKHLARMYRYGAIGVQKNLEAAANLYVPLANNNDLESQLALADLYSSPDSSLYNLQKAIVWFERAAELKSPVAITWLKNYNKKLLLEEEKKVREEEARLAAAKRKEKIAENTQKALEAYNNENWDEAYKLSILADMTNPDILANLAYLYLSGKGTAKLPKAGFDYAVQAAQLNSRFGQYLLAVCYDFGMGTEKNLRLAFYYYLKAAEGGDANAQYNIGLCYISGEGTDKNTAQAKYWFEKAIQQNVADAGYNLGIMYLHGEGVAKDRQAARLLFQWAKERGSESARLILQRDFFDFD